MILSEHLGVVPDCYRARLKMSHGAVERVCAQCGVRDYQLKMCSKCHSTWYCNKTHQREHWSEHKLFCIPKSASLRMAAAEGGGGLGGGGVAMGRGVRGGGTSAKIKREEKRRNPETNFNIDSAVLDEVVGSSLQYYQQPIDSPHYLDKGATGGHNEQPFQVWGPQGRGRRKSPVQDLSTPIDSGHHPLEASSHVSQSKTPPLYHVTDSVDTQSLEEGGFSQEWFARVLQLVMEDLNKYGVCVVDDFLGECFFFYLRI